MIANEFAGLSLGAKLRDIFKCETWAFEHIGAAYGEVNPLCMTHRNASRRVILC